MHTNVKLNTKISIPALDFISDATFEEIISYLASDAGVREAVKTTVLRNKNAAILRRREQYLELLLTSPSYSRMSDTIKDTIRAGRQADAEARYPEYKSFDDMKLATLLRYTVKDYLRMLLGNIELTVRNKEGTRYTTSVERAIKKEYAYALPKTTKQKIGDIINTGATREIHTVDITKTIDWQSSDFGQRSSCWWGAVYHRGSSDKYDFPYKLWEEIGGMAIRYWKNDAGAGRAWLFEHRPNEFIVFNAYGLKAEEFASICAHIFTEASGEKYFTYSQRFTFSVSRYDKLYGGNPFYFNTTYCQVITKEPNYSVDERLLINLEESL